MAASKPCFQDVVSFTLNQSHYDPWRPIMIDARNEQNHISLIEARCCVKRLIKGLMLYGVRADDVVCLHMTNSIMFPIISLAIMGIGARVTATNPSYTVRELEHHLKTSGTSFVITELSYLDNAKSAAFGVGFETHNVFLHLDYDELNHTGQIDTDHLMSFGKRSWIHFDDEVRSMTTMASFATTSGTEGLPKIAARSHFSLVAEARALRDTPRQAYKIRRLLTIPFFHAFAAPMVMINSFFHGNAIYVMKKFDQAAFTAAIERFNINETAMPPPLMLRFMALPATERKALKMLRRVLSGGACLSLDVQGRALGMFAAGARIQQCWGMTETGCIATFASEDDATGSVGRLIAGDAKVIDDRGIDITDLEIPGEILVRSPGMLTGYVGNGEATRALFDADGFMRTGDIGHFSPDGKIYLDGRKKELIKVRGFQVSPHEVENALLAIPDIIDAAVVGVQHADGSEVPSAYIVCGSHFNLSDNEIKANLLQSLCRYKVSDCQMRRVASIPKSATGKILRTVLKELVKAEQNGSNV